MAAKTGATAIPITPQGFRRVQVRTIPEASSQNGAKGQTLMVSAGYATAITGNPQTIQGFYRIAPQNGASDGAKTASYYVAEESIRFKAAYRGTLSESVRGLRLNLSVNSAGAAFLTYNTDSSSVGAAICQGWSSDWVAGDVNPEVYFTLRGANIQESN